MLLPNKISLDHIPKKIINTANLMVYLQCILKFTTRMFSAKIYLTTISPPPQCRRFLFFYLDFLVDLDFFIFLDFSSTLVHVYPLGMAKGSVVSCATAAAPCCCCLLADPDWLLFRLSHVDVDDDDRDEDDGKDEQWLCDLCSSSAWLLPP